MIGQFHTLFFGSVRMFFLGVLGFAVYGNEALHFSCEPDKREVNLFCYNQFRPITPQVNVSLCRKEFGSLFRSRFRAGFWNTQKDVIVAAEFWTKLLQNSGGGFTLESLPSKGLLSPTLQIYTVEI